MCSLNANGNRTFNDRLISHGTHNELVSSPGTCETGELTSTCRKSYLLGIATDLSSGEDKKQSANSYLDLIGIEFVLR